MTFTCKSCGRETERPLTKERCATCYWREAQPRRPCAMCGETVPICTRGMCNTCVKRIDIHKMIGAEAQLARGNVPCDVCQAPRARTVDHDHSTGKVRGRLCKACNIGLGSFRDDPRILRAAAAYLRKWRATPQ